jgi:predicted DCC family thiol-disulfide oxidoreductase YuxK
VGDSGALLIYDGDCGACTSAAAWIERRWHGERRPRAVALQRLDPAFAAAHGLTRPELEAAAHWVDDDRTERGARAIGEAMRAGDGAVRLAGRVLLLAPIATLAEPVYRVVARHRHRLPGSTPACRL